MQERASLAIQWPFNFASMARSYRADCYHTDIADRQEPCNPRTPLWQTK